MDASILRNQVHNSVASLGIMLPVVTIRTVEVSVEGISRILVVVKKRVGKYGEMGLCGAACVLV